ncbi:MAG: methytransferase partner Trm112 [Methanoregulaceae archaeon]|nr:methytransferase partner Trm112 [Methanoregulaceae archaeon]
MKRRLLDILCCPTCKGDLRLSVTAEEGDEIIGGTLTCQSCGVDYPIEEGIPDLLPREPE